VAPLDGAAAATGQFSDVTGNQVAACKVWRGQPTSRQEFTFTFEATNAPTSGTFTLKADSTCVYIRDQNNKLLSWPAATTLTITEVVPEGMKVSEIWLGSRTLTDELGEPLITHKLQDPGPTVQFNVGETLGVVFYNTDAPPPPPPPVPTGVCEGGVTKLVVKYIGAAPLNGAVRGKRRNPQPSAILPGQVSVVNGETHYTFAMTTLGGLFSPVANGRIGNNFQLYIGNRQIVDFHTSCSAPIYPGMQLAGTFEIVEVYSAKGGQIGPQ